ncbi:MAG: DUF86 domain-containing protein [bacterium]
MPNEKLILQYLQKLREYLSNLKTLQKYSFDEFNEQIEINWAINRGLQLIVECSIDLGEEIIGGMDIAKPNTYRETFKILSRKEVISSSVSKEMQRLVEFRNRLIHDYLYLDQEEIFEVLQNDLKHFEKYLIEIEKFLKK